jgi:hypothetical protein
MCDLLNEPNNALEGRRLLVTPAAYGYDLEIGDKLSGEIGDTFDMGWVDGLVELVSNYNKGGALGRELCSQCCPT